MIASGENDIDGVFMTNIPLNITYTAKVYTPDTVFVFDNNSSGSAPQYMDFDLKVKLIVHELKRTFNLDVLFDSGDHKLDMEDMSHLSELLKSLRGNEKMKIEIAAHTDDVGNNDNNMRLSQRRAQSVKDYLVKEGIASSRIWSKGYGEAKPVAANDSAEGRAKNRRVEVRVIEE